MGPGGNSNRGLVVATAVSLLVLLAVFVGGFPRLATAHTGDYILSVPAAAEVFIDGNLTAAEWSEAVSISLGDIPGNGLEATLLVKHNDSFLFMALDVTGDSSKADTDTFILGFDTGHDGLLTAGHEDLFYQGGLVPAGQAHLIFDGVAWSVHDAPYDEGLENHTGLASASDFGPSDLSPEDHRLFEFRIPLPLLGASPGDVIGFLAAVIDYDTGRVSYWPEPIFVLNPDDYGDLILDTPPASVDVLLLPPSQSASALAGETIAYRLDVINKGTAGDDTFDLTVSSSWPASFWNATGTFPLPDTDGDGIPDTGIVPPGSDASIVVKVEVPVDASGRNEAIVTANSTADPGVSSTALLITQVAPARFNPPHFDFGNDTDVPPDGLFNYLVVWANVTVAESGDYSVQGILFGPNLTAPISFAGAFASLTPGNETLGLPFSGQEIFASGIDGPYLIRFFLYDRNFALVDEGDHTTRAYAYTEFQKPPASFAPPHFDSGLDTDGDGLFDYLVVNATIQVDEAGMYLVDAVLRDPTFTLFVYTSNVTSLDVGLQTVPLWFDGVRINASDVDGPYTVDLTLYDYATFAFLDSDTHTTANYSHLDFDGPPASFAPPHFDSGLDTDGDGLFDYLVVDVAVDVADAGMVLLEAYLYDSTFTLFLVTSNVTSLEVGSQTVPLWFDGARINASERDGPYTVELYLYDYETFRFLDSDIHTTAAYSSQQFEGPEPLVAAEVLVTPTIDGAFSPGEWSDATAVDLSAIPGNEVPGLLLVKSDLNFLYVAYDATGDTTEDLNDVASIAFDTDHDGVATQGREDQFVQGGWVSNDQAHFVYDGSAGFWIVEDSPYDASLPNHMGLASAWGFGPSEGEGTPHRIYEFAVPLALLGVAPGDTLGFFGGSQPAPGLYDASLGGWSLWPVWNPGPLSLSEYGDLVLSTDLTPPTLIITAPSSGSVAAGSDVRIAWSASDNQSGLDYIEVSLDGEAPIVVAATVTGYTFLGLEDGAHTVVVRAVDVADNEQTASVDFTVDTLPPTLSILSPGSESILNTSRVEVAWVAEDATSGVDRFEVVLDGGAPTVLHGASLSLVLSDMADGSHTVEVRAIDVAGHAALASVEFVVDTVPPVLSVSLPVSGSVVASSSLEVAWLGTDQTSGIERIEVSLDGSAPVVLPATASSHTFAGVADGSHTVSVTVFDRAGNSADASVHFEVITFLLNPSGPYGPSPLVGLIVAIVAGTLLLLLVFRRRRGSPP